jgi:hypothetical protein
MSTDNNKGTPAGFIFQFEIALLELSNLGIGESVSLEKVDDVAKEDKMGIHKCTIQVKHSINSSSTNFGNTSVDLWKTFNIWIKKLLDKDVNIGNQFIAVTNNRLPKDSILKEKDFNSFLDRIKIIKSKQELDYQAKQNIDTKKGKSIKATIDRIDYAIKHVDELEIVFKNFEIKEKLNVKEEFLNNILLSTKEEAVKDRVYHQLLGWIEETSKEKWKNKNEAVFSKSDFELKYNFIRDNQTIINSLFRHQKEISVSDRDLDNRDEIYIKQIDDIERYEKEDIIKKAILDFVNCDVEITRLIVNKDYSIITKLDYEDFEKSCEGAWNDIKRKYIRKDLSKYTDDELNEIGCNIYDAIIVDLRLKFQDNWDFNVSTKYIQNGTFLKLSNSLKIGWNPKWEDKYKQ